MSRSTHQSYLSILRDNLSIKSSMAQQSSWTAGPTKIGLTGCPETTLSNHQATLRNIPEGQLYTAAEAQNHANIKTFYANNI
jgi:hypothetical protein